MDELQDLLKDVQDNIEQLEKENRELPNHYMNQERNNKLKEWYIFKDMIITKINNNNFNVEI